MSHLKDNERASREVVKIRGQVFNLHLCKKYFLAAFHTAHFNSAVDIKYGIMEAVVLSNKMRYNFEI